MDEIDLLRKQVLDLAEQNGKIVDTLISMSKEMQRFCDDLAITFENGIRNQCFIPYILDKLNVPDEERARLMKESMEHHKRTLEQIKELKRSFELPKDLDKRKE